MYIGYCCCRRLHGGDILLARLRRSRVDRLELRLRLLKEQPLLYTHLVMVARQMRARQTRGR
jgi:hypothetical protein